MKRRASSRDLGSASPAVYATLAATTLLVVALAAALLGGGRSLKPLRSATFDFDEPTREATTSP
jgi:hypothetical protein